ncbi:MAG: NAD(P)-binding domain-containing protein, partial [Thermaerobacter sp.]|nr:NAD(P)-binding domain-containing protein [Thermaerobacter sp.]
MDVGMVGLGRMGGAMARRLVAGGHRVAGYNRDRTKTEDLARRGVEPAYSLAELAQKLEPPRTVWTMVPAGQATDQVVAGLLEVLAA